MQISPRILLACAAATCLFSFSLPAQDTDAQARARKALEDKMKAIQSQPPVIEVEPAKPVAPQPKPAAPEIAPAQPAPVAPVARPAQTLAQPPAKPAPAKPAPPVAPWQDDSKFMPLPQAANPQAVEKAQEALQQKATEMDAQKAAQVNLAPADASAPAPRPIYQPVPGMATTTTKTTTSVEPVKRPAKTAVMPLEPIPAPPSSLSAVKQARLQDLLVRYQADQITPEEYHTQRAKILAGP